VSGHDLEWQKERAGTLEEASERNLGQLMVRVGSLEAGFAHSLAVVQELQLLGLRARVFS
jgi:hypothetical protein